MLRSKLLRLAVPGLLSVTSLINPACAWDDGVKMNERLLPLVTRVPEGLDAESLDVFGPNWTMWADETAALLETLYEGEPNAAVQLTTLQQLQTRRATLEYAANDPAYAPIRTKLLSLLGKLERRLDVFVALRNVLAEPASGVPASPFPAFAAALEELESTLLVTPNGSHWFPYFGSEGLNEIAERGSFTPADADLLQKSLARLNGGAELTPDQQQFLQQPAFRKLASSLSAAVSSLTPTETPQDAHPLTASAEQFLAALEEYELSGSRAAAVTMQSELQTILSLGGPSTAALSAAFDNHYRHHNLQLSVGEQFMQKFFSSQRSESGGVSEYVKDVYVSGCQWTDTVIGVDIRPCNTAAKFTLTIDGNNRSRTTGEVCSATVYNSGTARFRAEKDVLFDGERFSLCPSRVGVNASNNTYDAETCLRWVPIASKVARNFALDQAAERKPESDAYARRKISREVSTRFDRETSTQFAEAEQKIQNDLYAPLTDIGVRPEFVALSSTETHLNVRERLMSTEELAAGRAPLYPAPVNGLLIQVHQSLLSNGTDRLDFHGLRLTQSEVDARIKERLDRLMPNREDGPPADPNALREGETEAERDARIANAAKNANTRLIFDTIDPISFQFADGGIIMSLRAGLERPGEEEIPTQIISVPLKLSVEGDQVVMTRGTVGVKPAQRPRNVGEQIARAQIMRSKIEEGIPPRRTQDATKVITQQGKSVQVQVRSIDAEDGWLTVTVE